MKGEWTEENKKGGRRILLCPQTDKKAAPRPRRQDQDNEFGASGFAANQPRKPETALLWTGSI